MKGLFCFLSNCRKDPEDDQCAECHDVPDGASTAEEVDHLAGQNEGHHDGNDKLHADAVECLKARRRVAVRDFIQNQIGGILPADHQGHQHGAERHRDTFRPAVHEVEEAIQEGRHGLHTEKAGRAEVGAQTVGRDDNRFHQDQQGDDQNVALTGIGLALLEILVDPVGGDGLHQGDGGGNGRDQNEDIEDNAEQGAEGTHVGEHVLQRDEQQARAAQGDLTGSHALGQAVGDGRRDNGDTGHQRDERIGRDDDDGVLDKVLILAEVGAVGQDGAHGQRQGEEHLAAGGTENGDQVGRFIDEARADRIAGDKHELQAFRGIGEGQRTHDDDEQHHEQRRHTDFIELLNTAGDTALHDNHADDDEQDREDHAAKRGGQHRAEDLSAAHGNSAVSEAQLRHVQRDVLQAVAAEHGVEAHDQEGCDCGQPADPCELLADLLVGINRAELGLAADCKLGDHDNHTDKDREEQVHDQEGEAAALAHLVREAPDVSETDSGTNGSKQEA